MIAIRAQPVIPVRLGKQGENNVISIEFDISKWIEDLGDGTPALLHMRPEDDSPYLVSTTLEDGIVTWVVSSTDTAQAGTGKCELQYVSETGEVIKSETWLTTIAESLEEAGESPDPESGWVADLLAQIQEIIDTDSISDEAVQEALENYLAENPIEIDEDSINEIIATYLEENPTNSILSLEQVVSSTESSGKNVWELTTLSGNTYEFVVYNGAQGETGEKGDTGETGAAGADGADGQDGIGIASITTESSTESGGTNTVTITLEDNRVSSFTVLNGKDGADGADGADGEDGAAATIEIGTVTTGEAGTDASVTNSGTTTAAVFDFVIPRGADGEDGEDGADGADGADGKSAYEYAVDGGYTGAETEFATLLATIVALIDAEEASY